MSVDPALLGFAVVVFAGYAVQTVSGFGSMLVCVTFGAHLLDLRDLITLAVPVSLVQTLYIAVRHRDGIEWRLLRRRVLPLMTVGLAIGYAVFAQVAGSGLKTAFALMVLVLAARELWLLRAATGAARKVPVAASVAAIFGAGVIHGVYATGGPLLVYALGREGLDKHRFRSTLTAVWVVLTVFLVVGFSWEGRYTSSTALDLLVLLPAVPLGILVGEWLHHRVEERPFKAIVFVLLIAAAVSLLAS